MQNYHSHKSFSNINTSFKDSAMSYEDYAKRAVELGQRIITSVDHGTQGNYLRCWQAAQKYNLKFVYGVEAYWVKDRIVREEVNDKGKKVSHGDKANAHIIVLAKNLKGIYQINEMLSTANEDGYYYVPRVDIELLKRLDPENVLITTACVSFWGKIDKTTQDVRWHYSDEENDFRNIVGIFEELVDHFGASIMLEVQCHNTVWQKQINRLVLMLHYKYGVPLIAGMDSHYIYPHQKEERKWLREESGVRMDDEDHEFADEVYEDYPDEETFINRFRTQGILNESEIAQAIANTDTLLDFEDIVFDQSRKLPTIYPNLTQEERNQKYLELVKSAWEKYKSHVPSDRWEEYEESFYKEEAKMVVESNMSDYFLLDHEMVKLGKEMGGMITPSGRGSSGSWFTNSLLGMSTLDRFDLPVPLYPARFCTADRLKTSCPDLDLNLSDPEIFAKAQEQLLGKGHSYPMIAYGTLKYKSAFKLYARAQGLEAEEANRVSKQIEEYERALKEAEDEEEKELIQIDDYVDSAYMKYIEGSEPYRGIVVSKSQAPCAYMIYNGDIRSEVGIMRINANGGKKIVYTTVIDGYTAEEFGYIKNDLLAVTVISINSEAMRRAGLPQYTSKEIIDLTKNDPATWDIFAKGFTQGINQCQGAGTTDKLKTYKPRSLQDLSAFVAAIRPGFKSMAPKFLNREKFNYGIPSFDSLLKNDSTGSSWLLYQEDIMKCLGLAGFNMEETYPIIKAVSKKKVKVIAAAKERFIENFTDHVIREENMVKEEAIQVSEKIWQIIIDSSQYSFNACVTGRTRFLRSKGSYNYCPTIEEMYYIMNDLDYAKAHNKLPLRSKYRRCGYGKALSLFDDDRLYLNAIVDIRQAGVRPVYRITLEDGSFIECTDNHKFPTPHGEYRCDELHVGDNLYKKGEYQKTKFDASFTDGNFKRNIPQKGQMGFQKNPDGDSVKYLSFRTECVHDKKRCSKCGKLYSDKVRFEVHHRDHDRHNNDYSNFEWFCVSCHKKVHYANGRNKHGDKGYPVLTQKIISIEYVGDEMTYDVEMADPAHNFVIDNGIVTCNSHAVAVALDALYGAYLKAHYPMEYYSTLLDSYADKGNKDKVALIKSEMKKAFGISVAPCRFRQDNRTFYIDRENKQVADALTSVKFISRTIANSLYKMRDEQFDSFVDLLCVLDNDRAFTSKSITILIKMGYFDEFGSKGKLMHILDEFMNGKNKITKQLKDSTRQKRIEWLKDMEYLSDESDLSYEEQISFERQHYGTPISVYPECKRQYVALEIETKFSPKAKLYSISTGNVNTVRFLKKDFSADPISVGDIITITNYQKKPACTYVDGKRVPRKDVFEFWVYGYTVKHITLEDKEETT